MLAAAGDVVDWKVVPSNNGTRLVVSVTWGGPCGNTWRAGYAPILLLPGDEVFGREGVFYVRRVARS